MAVTRPLKEGSVTTYQAKVAAGFPDILASEMDADLDTIYAAWNGGPPTNSIGSLQIIDGSVGTLELADGAVTTAKLAAGAAAGNFVGARDFIYHEFGRNSAVAFTAFTEPKTLAQALLVGQVCRITLGGSVAVGSGGLLLALSTTGGTTLATPVPSLGTFTGGTFQLDALIGAVSASSYGVNVRWRLWGGGSTASAPVSGGVVADNLSVHLVSTVTPGGIRLAGVFSVAHSSSAVQIMWALSEVL